jgi:hypothetical protein
MISSEMFLWGKRKVSCSCQFGVDIRLKLNLYLYLFRDKDATTRCISYPWKLSQVWDENGLGHFTPPPHTSCTEQFNKLKKPT